MIKKKGIRKTGTQEITEDSFSGKKGSCFPYSSFFSRIFAESDGTPSFSRLFTAIIVVTLLTWDTYLVWTKGTVPGLADQALFAAVLYASNKASTAVTSVFEKK